MNREYNMIVERSISIPYSIDREDALDLIEEEWDEEIAEQCKNDDKILDKYMTKYAKRVSGGAHISEYFSEGDGEYTDYKSNWLELIARDTTDNGYGIDGTHKVLYEVDDEEDDEDGEQ